MSLRNQNGGFIRPGYEPLQVANAPTIGTASPGDTTASVAFTAPSNVGGAAITNYYAVSSPGQITSTSATSPISVTGLTNGTAYTFTVWAQNTYGPSPYSSTSNSVTPSFFYIEDVFSTYPYTGNGSSQTITNGIDLSGNGGLVWTKSRSNITFHDWEDTVRGAGNSIYSNSTNASDYSASRITAFNSNGYSLGSVEPNANNVTYASWTFRKQAKFFDVVTWTGNGTGSRAISHSLASTPGCIILKRTDAADDWYVVHRSASNFSGWAVLNTTAAFTTTSSGISSVGSTSFTVSSYYNGSGATWVAYVFAHDAGGFGASGSDNVISCGSYTGNGSSTGPTITLGYEPQWVMVKRATVSTGSWEMYDSMRGFTMGNDAVLRADTSGAEFSLQRINPTSTGFQLADSDGDVNANGSDYIYIAIRRGPMKTPTSGTSVFDAETSTALYNVTVTTGFPTDWFIALNKAGDGGGNGWYTFDRLRGGYALQTTLTAAEPAFDYGPYLTWANNTSFKYSGGTFNLGYYFRRAPGFFDVVCYTGNGTYGATNHNLGVIPELTIYKKRSGTSENWGALYYLSSISYRSGNLNLTDAFTTYSNDPAVAGLFSSTQFCKYYDTSGQTYVAYLFATVAGVSKVGSYTGTGTTKQIDCGFTGGARFVLIKRTDSTGDWYVYDSARGIVAGNDPYIFLNSLSAEVTNTDYVDSYSAGFELSSTAPAALNANGGTYIFLAIA